MPSRRMNIRVDPIEVCRRSSQSTPLQSLSKHAKLANGEMLWTRTRVAGATNYGQTQNFKNCRCRQGIVHLQRKPAAIGLTSRQTDAITSRLAVMYTKPIA